MLLPLIEYHKQKWRQVRDRHHRNRQFVAAWMRSPMKIGAFLPSSRALAEAMAAQVDLEAPGVVVELGPGTGVVTHALLQAGVTPDRLIVIERDRNMHHIMESNFPALTVLHADAMHLQQVLKEVGVRKVSAVVSSLPLLSMPKLVKQEIEEQMIAAAGEKGIIIQFTYGPKSPVSRHLLRRHHAQGRRVKTVLTNVPPAHVWVYRRGN